MRLPQLKPYQVFVLITVISLLLLMLVTAPYPNTFNSLMIPVLMILIGWGLIAMPLAIRREMQTRRPKTKRGAATQDMYTMIDRLLEYVDENEMTYLRQRLAEMEQPAPDQEDFPTSLDNLLRQRETGQGAAQRDTSRLRLNHRR